MNATPRPGNDWVRRVAFVFLVSSLAAVGADKESGEAMIVTYERSGGFIGMNQRLEISKDELRAFDRGHQRTTRKFTDEESKALAKLITAAEEAGMPKSTPSVPDGFQLRITAGQMSVEVGALGVPVGKSDGTPLGDLIAWLDAELTKALEGKARPSGMGPDDFIH